MGVWCGWRTGWSEPVLRDNEGIAITREAVLMSAVGGGKIDIRHDGAVVFNRKFASFVHAAEGAFVMGTAGSYL